MGEEIVSLPVPDDLLAEIFLRLPTPADILRASAACVSFRRVAAHRSFVRRFRKLHAPPLLGFFDDRVFHPPSHHTPLRRQPVPSLLPPTFPSHSFPPALAPGSSRTAAAAASSSSAPRLMKQSSQRCWCVTPCISDTSCFPKSQMT
ncbi:hypothetical protein ACQ4PT_015790 [Festuca glaucescens]